MHMLITVEFTYRDSLQRVRNFEAVYHSTVTLRNGAYDLSPSFEKTNLSSFTEPSTHVFIHDSKLPSYVH